MIASVSLIPERAKVNSPIAKDSRERNRFPGGDASHARVYVGPTLMGTNANLAVVTLSFQDVNGDGKPDLVINVQGGHFVFLNTGTQFRPVTASDHVNLSNP